MLQYKDKSISAFINSRVFIASPNATLVKRSKPKISVKTIKASQAPNETKYRHRQCSILFHSISIFYEWSLPVEQNGYLVSKRTLTCWTICRRIHAEKTEQLIAVFTSTTIHLIFVSVTEFHRAFCSSRKTKTEISAEPCTLSWRELTRLVLLKSTGPSFLISSFTSIFIFKVTLFGGLLTSKMKAWINYHNKFMYREAIYLSKSCNS